MKDSELQIIEQLTGVTSERIKLADDGFCSRGYVIDSGRIVFKFKKSPEVSYKTEIKALNFINTLNLGVNIQKVGWTSLNDNYLGVYGVPGSSLEGTQDFDQNNVAKQLAAALHSLHQAKPEYIETMPLAAELKIWEQRLYSEHSTDALRKYFAEDDRETLDCLFHNLSRQLEQLGEKLVCSHGDLGDGNILIDDDGKVGIIDFNEMCYLDEAADFMDVSGDDLRLAMLDAYGADEVLREKVRIRVLIRPLIVFGDYARRGDKSKVEKLAQQIRNLFPLDTE